MSLIFLSHSSKDDFAAVAINDWLRQNGWNDVFLDLDQSKGINSGERWERALIEHASRCEAVLFLVSKNWLLSDWCRREYELARKLNKRVFVTVVDQLTINELPSYLTETHQAVFLGAGDDHRIFRVRRPGTHEEGHVTFSAEGLARLRLGLSQAGLDPQFFSWPPSADPNRAPYRGLEPLEDIDAGIFFGREAPLVEVLDALRGLRETAFPRFFVILGASGTGKSSFLRAGLLPRLRRDDRNFLPLEAIRPERAAVTGVNGFVAALANACAQKGMTTTRAEVRIATGGGAETLTPILRDLVARAAVLSGSPKTPTVVVAVDQTEELFRAEGAAEGESLLTLLRDLAVIDGLSIIALLVIRSDSYDALEHSKPLEGLSQKTFPLLPMPRSSYRTVIEGPVDRLVEAGRKFEIEPSLTDALLADLEKGKSSDALPLLAFTLQQMFLDHEAAGRLTREDYAAFGGLKGAIEAASERVFADADRDARIPRNRGARLALLRRGLIPWLAGIDPDTKSPRRRRAPVGQIPEESRLLIDLLVEQRLLTRAVDDATNLVTLEPTHEALLRQWGTLKGWLEEDFALLVTLEGVRRAARDWDANARDPAWVAHGGGRLEEAARLDKRPDLAALLDVTDRAYLAACRDKESASRAKEIALVAAERRAAQRTRIGLVVSAALAIAAVGAAVYGFRQAHFASQQAENAEQQKEEAKRQTDLALKQKQQAEDRRNEALVTQSRFLSDLSRQANESSDEGKALLLALEALPDTRSSIARPFIGLAEVALDAALRDLREVGVLGTLGDKATGVVFSRDGQKLITVSNGEARIWDSSTLEPKAILKAEGLDSAAFSPDGREVVTGSGFQTVALSTGSGGRVAEKIANETFRYNPIAEGAGGGKVRIWDSQTGKQIAEFSSGNDREAHASFSPDGLYLLTVSNSNEAHIWSRQAGKVITVLKGHTDTIFSAAFNSDGSRVVTASYDTTAIVWDAKTGEIITKLTGHEAPVLDAKFSPNGQYVLTGSADESARLWELEGSKSVRKLNGHSNWVESVTFSSSGQLVATASADGTAIVWNLTTQRGAIIARHPSWVVGVTFSADGRRIATASYDHTVRLWEVTASRRSKTIGKQDEELKYADLSTIGEKVVATYNDRADIIDLETGKITALTNVIGDATFSPDGLLVAAGSSNNSIVLWNATTGQVSRTFPSSTSRVYRIAFRNDGLRLIVTSADNLASIWDVKSGVPLVQLKGHTDFVTQASFSHDGRLIVTASHDSTVRIWDAESGEELRKIQQKDSFVADAAFSPDDRQIIVAGGDDRAYIWQVQTEAEPIILDDHSGAVQSAMFSADGRRALTASRDKTVIVWDVRSRQAVARLLGHQDFVWRAEFTGDGQHVLSASKDGTMLLWPVFRSTEEIVAQARQVIPRCLTHGQRDGAFLDLVPPSWCVEMEKWPYNTPIWQDWLRKRKQNLNPPLPGTPVFGGSPINIR